MPSIGHLLDYAVHSRTNSKPSLSNDVHFRRTQLCASLDECRLQTVVSLQRRGFLWWDTEKLNRWVRTSFLERVLKQQVVSGIGQEIEGFATDRGFEEVAGWTEIVSTCGFDEELHLGCLGHFSTTW
jgi:hypothetical protein